MKGAFAFIKLVKAISDGNEIAATESINQLCDIYAEEGNSMVRDEIDVIVESGDFLKNLDFKKVKASYFVPKEKPEKPEKKSKPLNEVEIKETIVDKGEKTLCDSSDKESSLIKNNSVIDDVPKSKPLKKESKTKPPKEDILSKKVSSDSKKEESENGILIKKEKTPKKSKEKSEKDDSFQLSMFGEVTSL